MNETAEIDKLTIIGAGVAGLTLAVALCQESSLNIQLLDGRQDYHGGAALAMAPNAMWVLRRLGVADQITAQASRIDHYRFLTATGRLLHAIDLRPLTRHWDESAWCVSRSHILDVLRQQLPAPTLHLGSPVHAVKPEAEGWRILIDDGPDIITPWLVGADGVHSVVRRDLFDNTPLSYRGFVAFRGTLSWHLPEAHTVFQVWGPQGEFGFSPMGGDEVYWFATMRWPDPAHLPGPQELMRQFTSWCDPIGDLIQNTWAENLLIHPIFDRLTSFPKRPGATLIGDAAHAMTPNAGQGACQAMLDAWFLKSALQSSPAQAFERYHDYRLPAALNVARWSRKMGRGIHLAHPWLRKFRNMAFSWASDGMVLAFMQKVVGKPQ